MRIDTTKYVCRAPAPGTSVCLAELKHGDPYSPIVAPGPALAADRRRTCGQPRRNSPRIVDSVVTGA